MNIRKIVKKTIREFSNNQQVINESWYHGTPDAREVEKNGNFSNRTVTVTYINDLDGYYQTQEKMKEARENDNMELYHMLLDKIPQFKQQYKYSKPIFLTDKHSIARSYADSKRAYDYQNAKENIFEVIVNCNNVVKIYAPNQVFRFINIDNVKQGFINAGIQEDKLNKIISMFNFYTPNGKGIQTDVIGAIASWFGFDCVDIVGVLDSYHGGNEKSTVRMVLNTSKIKIK